LFASVVRRRIPRLKRYPRRSGARFDQRNGAGYLFGDIRAFIAALAWEHRSEISPIHQLQFEPSALPRNFPTHILIQYYVTTPVRAIESLSPLRTKGIWHINSEFGSGKLGLNVLKEYNSGPRQNA
jgi:hypothetical protein